MKNMKKVLVMTMAALLLVAVTVAGTVAYLTDVTPEVSNTFTTAGIDIDLTETWNADSNDEGTELDHWTAQMIPGVTYDKDPIVSVLPETDVEIYLFVKVEKSANFDTLIDYTSNLEGNGWTQLEDEDGVYYRIVGAEDTGCKLEDCRQKDNRHWHMLSGDEVTIKEGLNVDDIPASDEYIKYTAYACQTAELNVEQAWAQLNPPANP